MIQEYDPSAGGDRNAMVQCDDGPFVHRLHTKKNKYIYDVNSGEILRADDVTWDIIEESCLPMEDVLAKYSRQHAPEAITAAYEDIAQHRCKQGLFRADHPRVQLQYGTDYIRDKIAHRRGQLTLCVTEECNFRCSYCHFALPDTGIIRDHTTRRMSWEVARAAIDEFLKHCKANRAPAEVRTSRDSPGRGIPLPSRRRSLYGGVSVDGDIPYRTHIGFYGGEPLLNFPLIKKCTQYVLDKMGPRGRFVSFGLSTNGYLLKGEAAEFLGDHDFILRVSLDGPAEVHDRHRRTADHESTWAEITNNLKHYARRYPLAALIIAATVARTESIQEVNNYWASADWIPWRANVSSTMAVDPWPGYYGTDQGNHGSEQVYRDYLSNVVRGRMGLGLQHRDLLLQQAAFDLEFEGIHRRRWLCARARQRGSTLSPDSQCVLGGVRVFVTVDGEYYPCERVPECDALRIGSVATGLDAERATTIMEEFVTCTRAQCERCWCLSFCALRCVGSMADRGKGYSQRTKEQWCQDARKMRHMFLVDYCEVLEANPHAFDYLRQYEKLRELSHKAAW